MVEDKYAKWVNDRLRITVLVSIAAFLGPIATVMYLPSLKTIENDLHTTEALVALTLSCYTVSLAFFPLVRMMHLLIVCRSLEITLCGSDMGTLVRHLFEEEGVANWNAIVYHRSVRLFSPILGYPRVDLLQDSSSDGLCVTRGGRGRLDIRCLSSPFEE